MSEGTNSPQGQGTGAYGYGQNGEQPQPPAMNGTEGAQQQYGSTTDASQGYGSAPEAPNYASTADASQGYGSTTDASQGYGSAAEAPAYGSAADAPAYGSTAEAPGYGSAPQAGAGYGSASEPGAQTGFGATPAAGTGLPGGPTDKKKSKLPWFIGGGCCLLLLIAAIIIGVIAIGALRNAKNDPSPSPATSTSAPADPSDSATPSESPSESATPSESASAGASGKTGPYPNSIDGYELDAKGASARSAMYQQKSGSYLVISVSINEDSEPKYELQNLKDKKEFGNWICGTLDSGTPVCITGIKGNKGYVRTLGGPKGDPKGLADWSQKWADAANKG